MLVIDENYVKNILGEYATLLQNIHRRILCIHRELIDTDELIQSVSIKKIAWDKEGSGQAGIKRDLTDVMLMHQRLAREREIELRTEMFRLTEEEESINRIWVCFHALRGREYTFLEKLYVQRLPYKAVQEESKVSHRTFEKVRMQALKKIVKMYNSEINNLQIINLSGGLTGDFVVKKNSKVSEYEQLKLNI
jgi:hypothetical protein